MSIIPDPRTPFDDAPPACVPGCIVDHSPGSPEDGSDGCLYCRTAADSVSCGTAFRQVADVVEVATDRTLVADPADLAVATLHRVIVSAPDCSTSYSAEGARALAFALLARADLIERRS